MRQGRSTREREEGVALVMVLAFMSIAIPLVTAALGLASALSVDSRVKTRVAKSQYSALGGAQHALYRLIYEAGYADGLPIGTPDNYTIALNGKQVTVTVEKFSQPPSSHCHPTPTAAEGSRPSRA